MARFPENIYTLCSSQGFFFFFPPNFLMWVDGLIWLEVREKSRYPLDLLQLPVFVLVMEQQKFITNKKLLF